MADEGTEQLQKDLIQAFINKETAPLRTRVKELEAREKKWEEITKQALEAHRILDEATTRYLNWKREEAALAKKGGA